MTDQVSECQWEFDDFDGPNKAKSWVELFQIPGGLAGLKLSVFSNEEEHLSIEADRDQWGTWLTFSMGEQNFTIGQEDQTKSFLDALIAGLLKLKELTLTIPPTYTESKKDEKQSEQ